MWCASHHLLPVGTTAPGRCGTPYAAAALGTNVQRERLTVYVLGVASQPSAVASSSSSSLAWAPSGWTYPETFLFFAAIIVGGLGNNAGATLGAAIVLGGILERWRSSVLRCRRCRRVRAVDRGWGARDRLLVVPSEGTVA